MLQRIIIALGAGFASAILFIVPIKGTVASALFGVVAPLPLMIACIGFGQIAGLVSFATAIVVVALLVHPVIAGMFGAWIAIPVALLAQIALLRRTGAGLAVASAAGISVALALTLILVAILSYGSWDTAVASAAAALSPWIDEALSGRRLPDNISALEISSAVVRYAPAMAAAWTTLTLCVNLWVAGRLALASRLLARPWPNVPDTLRMPRSLALVFACSIGLSFLSGLAGGVAACFAASLGVAFAFQGLGALHAMTRGVASRPAILAGAYAVLVGLIPWPLVLAALLGIVDCFAPLPRKPDAKPAVSI